MRVFITGGCKNGKSYIAQRMAMEQGPLRYYIATMRPGDDEDKERVLRHQMERKDWGFITVEAPEDISQHTKVLDFGASLLLDSTTALLSNEMFPPGGVNTSAGSKVADDVSALITKAENIVVVSDYIYGDYMSAYDELTRSYCKALAMVDKAAAAVCDTVMEITYGLITYHKGGGL